MHITDKAQSLICVPFVKKNKLKTYLIKLLYIDIGALQKMATARSQRVKLKPNDEAVYYASTSKDKTGFEIKYINSFKGKKKSHLRQGSPRIVFFMTNQKNSLLGRGVFSSCHYRKGDFLVEYRGDIITKEECERRRRLYHNALEVFLFEFRFNGKQLWYVYCFIKCAIIYVSIFSKK